MIFWVFWKNVEYEKASFLPTIFKCDYQFRFAVAEASGRLQKRKLFPFSKYGQEDDFNHFLPSTWMANKRIPSQFFFYLSFLGLNSHFCQNTGHFFHFFKTQLKPNAPCSHFGLTLKNWIRKQELLLIPIGEIKLFHDNILTFYLAGPIEVVVCMTNCGFKARMFKLCSF